jgi:predicted RNA-binding Zn-ribbon protein involved in translation (DUF1610 family)
MTDESQTAAEADKVRAMFDMTADARRNGMIEPEKAYFRPQAMPVECDLCGWKGRRMKPRSAPCPNCGNGKVQYRD